MSKARYGLLSLMMVLAADAILASSASAVIEFKWKVGGTELKAGETRGLTINNDSKLITLSGKVAGSSAKFLSSNVSLAAGAKNIGGVPGKDESVIVFKGNNGRWRSGWVLH
jgi:hypothetical protein